MGSDHVFGVALAPDRADTALEPSSEKSVGALQGRGLGRRRPAWTVREYRPGDERGILELFAAVFGGAARPRTLEDWVWEFERNPAGREIVVAADPDGRIVAHFAMLPAAAVFEGTDVRCHQGVDSMVDPSVRREGAFLAVARRAFETFGVASRCAYGYGFPNETALSVGGKLLGYLPVACPLVTLGRNFHGPDEPCGGAHDAVELTRLDARVDRLWARLRGEVALGLRRDARYLAWRYLECPSAEYRVFAWPDGTGELRALWVTRAGWMGRPILAVAELLCERRDAPAAERALAHAMDVARAAQQVRVEVWLPPSDPRFQLARGLGFAPEPCGFRLAIRPYEPRLRADWAREHMSWSIGDADAL